MVIQENIKPDNLGEKHRDALLKKFVKKWNGNKLPKNYYMDADSLWVSTSPQVEPRLPIPSQNTHVTPAGRTRSKVDDSWSQLAVSTPTDSSFPRPSFGTFGKRSGATALRELQAGAVLSRECCHEALNNCIAAQGCGNVAAADADGTQPDQSMVFYRGDSKRTGVRHAITVCRTAL